MFFCLTNAWLISVENLYVILFSRALFRVLTENIWVTFVMMLLWWMIHFVFLALQLCATEDVDFTSTHLSHDAPAQWDHQTQLDNSWEMIL